MISPTLLVAGIVSYLYCKSAASPIITDVYPEHEKCLRYIIPPEDNAHMVFAAISASDPEEVEDYFSTMIEILTKEQLKELPDKKPTVPKEVADKMTAKDGPTSTYFSISKPDEPPLRKQMLAYGVPVIVRNLVDMSGGNGQGRDVPLGGFQICFTNTADWKDDEVDIHVIFDSVLISGDDAKEEENARVNAHRKKQVRKEQLSPLEMNLEECVSSAEDILDEFKYMEKRERRMRQTADSTNTRVRYFSYLSIAILLSVTWLQVTYLKSYFKKKKLM